MVWPVTSDAEVRALWAWLERKELSENLIWEWSQDVMTTEGK